MPEIIEIDELNKINDLLFKGKFQETLKVVEELEKRDNLTSEDLIKLVIRKSSILNKSGKYEEGLLCAKEAQTRYERLERENHLLILDVMISMVESLSNLGKNDEGLMIIEEGIQKLSSIPFDPTQRTSILKRKSSFLNYKGMIFGQKGDLELAQAFFNESLTLAEEINNKQAMASTLHSIGIIYQEKAILELALQNYNRSLALFREIGNKQSAANTFNNIGTIFLKKGELDEAMDYFCQSRDLFKEIGHKQAFSASLNNIGEIYRCKGDLDKALDFYQQSFLIDEEFGNKIDLAISFINLGELHRQRNEFDEALNFLERGLVLTEEIGHHRYTAYVLYYLTAINVDVNNLINARGYLQQLKEIKEKKENRQIKQQYLISKAVYLSASQRPRDRGKAEALLEQVVEDNVVDHDLTVTAILLLCGLLIVELRASGNEEILIEVKNLTRMFHEIAKDLSSYWLIAESYALQSKLALIDLDIAQARQLLNKAQITARDKGLLRLMKSISEDYGTLLERLSEWEEIRARNAPIRERMEFAELEPLVGGMIRKQFGTSASLSKEDPVLVIIVASRGHTVHSKTFGSELRKNMQLLGGFLTAINTISSEVFSVSGCIDRIKHRNFTLMMQVKSPILVCYAFKGYSYSAKQKLNKFMTEIQLSSNWEIISNAAIEGMTLDHEEVIIFDKIIDEMFYISS